MEPFRWKVCVPAQAVHSTREALRELAVRVQAEVPLSYAILVPAQGEAAAFLDVTGQALDLGAVSFDLILEVAAFFGPGCWVLPGEGHNGAPVVSAYKS